MSVPELERHTDPVDGSVWLLDTEFLESNWTCIWGRGCEGMGDTASPELQQGCCSAGAQMLDEDESMRTAAIGLTLDPTSFQFSSQAVNGGMFSDDTRTATRVVDGACIFLNRPGFAGGAGCALHLAAVAEGEDPIDYKPAICWQLPLKVENNPDGSRTLRRWTRTDWGSGGAAMAWCCTETGHADGLASAYVGDAPVAESLNSELIALVGPDIAVAIRDRPR